MENVQNHPVQTTQSGLAVNDKGLISVDPNTGLVTETSVPLEFTTLALIIAENEGLRQRATSAINGKVNSLKELDLTKLDLIVGDAINSELNDLAGRGKESIEVNLQRRSPLTKKMDEIRSIFTGQEGDIKNAVELATTWILNWNKEKYRRAQLKEKEDKEVLDKQNAETDYALQCANSINAHYMAEVGNTIDKFNQAFNLKTVEEFPEYEPILKGWTPTFQPFPYNALPNPILNGEAMLRIRVKTEGEVFPILAKDFVQKLSDERDRLIALIPSRIAELQRIAANPNEAIETQKRLDAEAEERNSKLEQEMSERNEAQTVTAETEKLNNIIDVATSSPAIQLSKGAKVKEKYDITTHKAFLAIIQSWVKNNMSLMTMEELNKKLSFMVTAATKSLNDPKNPVRLEAEGLYVVQDFTTRTTK